MIKLTTALRSASISPQAEVTQAKEAAQAVASAAPTASEFQATTPSPVTLTPSLEAAAVPAELKMKSFRLPYGMAPRQPVSHEPAKQPAFDPGQLAATMAIPENGTPSFDRGQVATMAIPENGTPSFDRGQVATMAIPENGTPSFDRPRNQVGGHGNSGIVPPRVDDRSTRLAATLLRRLFHRYQAPNSGVNTGDSREALLRQKLQALQSAIKTKST